MGKINNIMRRVVSVTLALVLLITSIPHVAAQSFDNNDSKRLNSILEKAGKKVSLEGLFDVKSLEQGVAKHLYVNTIPFDANITASSSDDSTVKVSVVDGNGVKVEGLKPGTATITVVASADGKDSTTKTFTVQIIKPRYEDSNRTKTNINKDWTFMLAKDLEASALPKDPSFDDSSWENVNVPHGWNAQDGADGGNNYHKGIGWYRKTINFSSSDYAGKKIFIEFKGASKVTELFINGEKIGRHEGGYSIFRFDITDKVNLDSDNVIVVSVDNRINDLMPLSGDFTVFGGMYRDVSIIATDTVHIDLMDEGSSGVYWTQKDVETKNKDRYKDKAEVTVKTKIVNDSDQPKTVKVDALVSDDMFNSVANYSETVIIPANSSFDFVSELEILNPRLWNGTIDPYLYNVKLTITYDNEIVDTESDRIGFRYYYVDADKGFFLNGEPYRLHGVNRHQDWLDKGYAISYKEHDEDMAMMDEIGANTIRFAHYQHDQYLYELSDERGIVVWAEIPLVNGIKNTPEFKANAETNLRELIKQGMNRPSIIMWGIHNEQWPNDTIVKFLENLRDLSKETDPSRLVTLATAQSEDQELSWTSDISAWNKYFGLYESQDIYGFAPWIDNIKRKYPDRKIGMGEYGVGSNLDYHEENPPNRAPGTSFGAYQTEEFQSKFHEVHWQAIAEREWIWGTYVWNMFEFGSDTRSEAGRLGINNKGLVSYDREIKKDVFYFYKANWSDQPVNRITSSRFYERFQDDIKAKVYSNLESVELFLNGVSQGKVEKADAPYGMFEWDKITLKMGENEVVSVATDANGETYVDTVTWTRKLHSEPGISSTIAMINEADPSNMTISKIPADTTIKTLPSVIKPLRNSSFSYFNAFGEVITDEDTIISNGMVLRVTSEDGTTSVDYRFEELPISYRKPVTVSSIQNTTFPGNLAVDGNDSTRWSTPWPGTFPQHIIIDLQDEYILSNMDSLWYSFADRSYDFRVETSLDGKNFTTVLDNQTSGNKASGWTGTDIPANTIGRYVKLTITGSNAVNASASIFEILVQGFKLESSHFNVDLVNQEITHIGIQYKDDADLFLSYISASGNYKNVELTNLSKGRSGGKLTDQSKLVVTDATDRKVTFDLKFSEDTFDISSTEYDVNLTNRVISKVPAQVDRDTFMKSLNVVGSFTYKFLLEGEEVKDTPITEGMQIEISNISGTIISTYTIHTVEGTKTPISENKNVSVSDTTEGSGQSNQQVDNPVTSINDGKQDTRWAGSTGPGGNNKYFPAQVEFNLGKEFVLTSIKIDWFNSSAKRAYQYAIDILPQLGIVTKTIDEKDNLIQDYTEHIMDINDTEFKVQDLRFNVLGTDTTSIYHVASVHEFKVYGWHLNSDVYTLSGRSINIGSEPVSLAKFRSNMDIGGNLTLKYLDSEGNEIDTEAINNNARSAPIMIDNGTTILITDHEGREFNYSVVAQTAPEVVEKGALDTLIKEVEAKDLSDYTESSVEVLNDALTYAKAIMADPAATQNVVDGAVTILSDALKGLVSKEKELPVVKSALEEKVLYADTLKSADFTKESFDAMTKVLADAKAVLLDDAATQEQVDKALQSLNAALSGLKQVEAPPEKEKPGEGGEGQLPGTGLNNEFPTLGILALAIGILFIRYKKEEEA